MIKYRSFLNTDPPSLIEVWQKQVPCRSLTQVVDRKMLDQMVFAKPYFDPAGLIIAFDQEQPVGFAHAGFAPNAELDCIDHSVGILAQMRVVDRADAGEIASGLWRRTKEYYQRHGTKVCFAGGRFPHSPFYTGLYGGSRIPGIPADDARSRELFELIGFSAGDLIDVMQISLTDFRPPVSRSQMGVRRQYQVAAIVDPLLPNWWECCTFGWAEVFGFRISRRSDGRIVGSVLLWDIQPISSQWGTSTMGLVGLVVNDDFRKQGLATFLVGESLRHLAQQGVAIVEVQLRASDEPAIALTRRIGFEKISQGTEMVISID